MTSQKKLYALQGKRVWVAGHRGLVGSALLRRLEHEDCEILIAPREKVDLRAQDQLERWIKSARPQAIFLAAARVGGIHANATRPAEFAYDNLMIQANVIAMAQRHRVEKLMVLGSSCIYPRLAEQPIAETALLSGPLEPTNRWYAVAKIAGITLAQAFRQQHGMDAISVMPTNLYGPNDNFDLLQSHVVPALIAKAHEAKRRHIPSLEIWGTGRAIRELLYIEDAADGMVHLMQHYSGEEIVNLGTGRGISINDLAALVCRIVGFAGTITHDFTKPDGTPSKVLDVSRLAALGWHAKTPLEAGLDETYRWYCQHVVGVKGARFGHG
jgi:GDP-L-fucose synthase